MPSLPRRRGAGVKAWFRLDESDVEAYGDVPSMPGGICHVVSPQDRFGRVKIILSADNQSPSGLGVGAGSVAVAGPVVGRLGGARWPTRRFEICTREIRRNAPRHRHLVAGCLRTDEGV